MNKPDPKEERYRRSILTSTIRKWYKDRRKREATLKCGHSSLVDTRDIKRGSVVCWDCYYGTPITDPF